MDRKQGGLNGRVMVDFFADLLNVMGRVESAGALYRSYTAFCLDRDIEPASGVDFDVAFRRLLSRIVEIM